MNETFEVLFGLLGGLAVFIYGMNMMSECLQKAAGEKMKTVLAMLTKNPLLGVLAGALTTAVLQSSSATTVMAIGFISAGLISLPQAISIIFGANIGTTITAQIIAFKLSDYIYLIIFAGFIITLICKTQKVKNIGQTIFAFGLLFLGIETMGSVMKPLADSPIFTDMMSKVSDVPLLGVAVGTLMTLVVQSSSATIAVLQSFAEQPMADGVTSIIGLAGAIPILIGDNIGTTITAILASVSQSRDAKRAALAHCLFNVSGCLLFIWFIEPYSRIIQFISPKGAEVEVISRQIANAHTGFNITMTLIWIPLIAVMVRIVMKLIPDGKEKYELKQSEPQFLDNKIIGQPVAAFNLVAKEVMRCADIVKEMLMEVKNTDKKIEKASLNKVIEKADIEHSLCGHINEYLAEMFSEGVLTEEQAVKSTHFMRIMCDIDRMGMCCKEIAEAVLVQNEKKQYSKDAIKELKKATGIILEMYEEAIVCITNGEPIPQKDVVKKKEAVMRMSEKMRTSHMERVSKKKCDAKLTVSFNNILHDIDRMGNSCVNLIDMASNEFKSHIFS